MSDLRQPPSAATLTSLASKYVVRSEPFEPTYALLDPEALDLHDFDDGFDTGVEDFNVEPPPSWEDDLLSVEALEDLFQSPPNELHPPPELVSFFEGELPAESDNFVLKNDQKEASAQPYPSLSKTGFNTHRANTLSPRSLSEHPIFNTHDTPVHDDQEPFEVRPVEFFTSRKPLERKNHKAIPPQANNIGIPNDELIFAEEDSVAVENLVRKRDSIAERESTSSKSSSTSLGLAQMDALRPIEVIDHELSRSLSDLKREAQERAARRTARRTARRARREALSNSYESQQETPALGTNSLSLGDGTERHTLDESLSSRDSEFPFESEIELEEELLDHQFLRAPKTDTDEELSSSDTPHSLENPRTKERLRIRTKTLAFMGSQGGVGLSLIVANLGVALARLGFKVALADFNPSGLNLHTYLGVEPIISTPSDLLRLSPDPKIERVPLEEAGCPERHLWLCRPALALLSSIPIEHRMRAFQALKKIDADIILMDLGHEADQFSLERYREATKSIIVFRPSTISIERGHAQLRAALFSALIAQGDDASIVARALLMADHVGQLNTPFALLKAIERVNPQAAILMRERLLNFEPMILLNQCKTHADRDLTLDLCAILQRKWRISASPLGAIDYDEVAHQDVRQRIQLPMMLTHSGSSICSELERFARRFIRELLKVEST